MKAKVFGNSFLKYIDKGNKNAMELSETSTTSS
jgi:hypothetical protein